MAKYELEEGKGLVREEEESEKDEETAEDMKSILQKKMEEAWRQPEAREMRKKLSKIAKTHWKPQIEEAIKTTKYAEELKSRAREIKYNEKVKKVWE